MYTWGVYIGWTWGVHAHVYTMFYTAQGYMEGTRHLHGTMLVPCCTWRVHGKHSTRALHACYMTSCLHAAYMPLRHQGAQRLDWCRVLHGQHMFTCMHVYEAVFECRGHQWLCCVSAGVCERIVSAVLSSRPNSP